MKLNNPFVLSGYKGPEYFCDRKAETARLLKAVLNNSNVTLVAPRRYGKTGLILNTFEQLSEKDNYSTVYIDIFGTQNMSDFTRLLASAIIGRLDTHLEKLGAAAKRLLQAIRPTLSYDGATGAPTLSVDVSATKSEFTLKSIFDYLAERGERTVIAIDEFQQIEEYPEKGIEATLRGFVQLSPARFIFSGSKQHIMRDMFMSPKRPFYQSTTMMPIDVIDEDSYYTFAERFFTDAGRRLDRAVFHTLYNRLEGITWYVQALLWDFYASGKDITEARQIDEAIASRVKDNEYDQQRILDLLPPGARNLLKAIAVEGKVKSPQSGAFISRHGLNAASSVRRSLETLVNKEIVYPDKTGYVVYDRFLGEYLRTR